MFYSILKGKNSREKPESAHGRGFSTIPRWYAICPRNVDIELCSHVYEPLGR